MSKSKRKKHVSVSFKDIVEKYSQKEYGGDASRVARAMGISVSTVYRALRSARSVDEPRPADDGRSQPIMSLSVMLPELANDAVEVQVRNGGGVLLGTLRIESGGLRYRRPNQKLPADRLIAWTTLDKLMQLGVL